MKKERDRQRQISRYTNRQIYIWFRPSVCVCEREEREAKESRERRERREIRKR
jgi:hypothetical protein